MNKETVDLIVAGVQLATLIAVIIYVWKTWQLAIATKNLADITKDMSAATQESAKATLKSAKVAEDTLQELRESRDQESAPYVMVYFEIPTGRSVIYLVVKNVGKTTANDIKFSFIPRLQSGTKGVNIDNIWLIKNGLASLAPGEERRTFFDSTIGLFKSPDTPLQYTVNISYFGGLRKEARTYKQVLDLKALEGLLYTSEKGLSDLVKQVEKLVSEQSKTNRIADEIADSLKSGIWIRNQDFIIRDLKPQWNDWQFHILAKLKEFRLLWASTKESDEEINPASSGIQAKCLLMSEQILAATSNSPDNISNDILQELINIAAKLSQLGSMPFYPDGGESILEFEKLGDSIITIIEAIDSGLGFNADS